MLLPRSGLRSCGLFLVSLPLLWAGQRTALDRYVEAPDSHYRYGLVATRPGPDYTAYILDMTSQAWRSPSEVDPTEWHHWLTIIRPAKVRTSTGLLYITNGDNGQQPPEKLDSTLLKMAIESGAVTGELRMVPNQPLRFRGDSMPQRVEDEFIAYTWDKYIRTGDELWLARLPMTKSAVRGMDTMTAFCAKLPEGVKVDKFVVAGASKRGWTTWTTAAVDRRVVAIMPLVIDVLNMEPSMIHHWQAYGFWAPAVKDYQEKGIMDRLGTPEMRRLMEIEEPYSYRDRFQMPKYIINASGDQFFLPDSSQFYFGDLPGEKYLRYVPNTDHSLKDSDAAEGMLAFFDAIVNQTPRPRFSWSFAGDAIRLEAKDRPREVKLWQTANPKARDFRLDTIGAAWRATPLRARPGGLYTGTVRPPAQGWAAYYLELTYPGTGKHALKFTTAIRVTPDRLPYPPPRGTVH